MSDADLKLAAQRAKPYLRKLTVTISSTINQARSLAQKKKGPTDDGQPPVLPWRKCMGIEPTRDGLPRLAPDLKSGSPTSELGTSG